MGLGYDIFNVVINLKWDRLIGLNYVVTLTLAFTALKFSFDSNSS